MNGWRPGRRDRIVGNLLDAVLLLASARMREVIREGARQAVFDAAREPLAPSPVVGLHLRPSANPSYALPENIREGDGQ